MPDDDDLLRRLPLPLAQLGRRSYNAVSPLSRLNTAYCLWEASLKLLGATAIVVYAERGQVDAARMERLKNLARPSLGHWWEFVRLLVPALADGGDEGFRAASDLLFGGVRDDMPRAAGLDSALREALDGQGGSRSTVRLGGLFERLIRFRNREIGHGPLGQQAPEFQDRMGRAVLAGVVEVLGRLDVTAGRRLVYVASVVRDAAGGWRAERFEMIGEASRRIRPLLVPAAEAAALPHPERVYLELGDPDRPVLQPLHPLVLCNHETAEVSFLNGRRGLTKAEYLCYHPGRVVERPDVGPEHRELLARVLGLSDVGAGQVDSWAARSAAEDPPVEAAPVVAARRLGEFELLSELGRGGMGVVYRAWQPSLGRQVALKRLLSAGDAKAEARFTREIHALGRVDHPNLVKTYTSGSDGDRWFYAMELVEGATLAAVCETIQGSGSGAGRVDLDTWRSSLSGACEQARRAEQPIPSDDPGAPPRPAEPRPTWAPSRPQAERSYARHVVDLVRQVAGAAHALHEAGVVHRDIKPGNIMVTADGQQAVLMDLGLAQLADDVHGRLTRTRQFVGTLRYASPEQVLAVGGVDRRSDVYSLGATLWELLTLRPMFGATEQTPTPDLMQRIQYEEPEPPRRYHPGIGRDLEAIVLKCLAKDPRRRYETAADLADDLRRYLEGESVRARREPMAHRLWRKARRHPAATVAALFAAATAATLAFAVPATLAARRTEALTARIDDLLERGEATGPGLAAVDELIGRLDRVAPQHAAARRAKLAHRIRERIAEEVRDRPSVAPEDERRLRAEIGSLAARDPEGARELEQALARRLRSWQVVGRLAPPFEGVERVFDPSWMAEDSGGLAIRGADPRRSISLPTRIECRGNVRFDVTLRAGTLGEARELTLYLYDNRWRGGVIRGLAYDRAGRRLAMVDDSGGGRTWDLSTREPTELPPPPAGSASLLFGRTRGGAIAGLRDVAAGRAIPEGRSARIGAVVTAVAPAGRAWAVGDREGRVAVFEAPDDRPRKVREVRLAGREVTALAVGPDARLVVAGTRDGSIALIDPAGEGPPRIFDAHLGEVGALALDSAGGLVASGGADTRVKLWDAATGAAKGAASGHTSRIGALAFSPDGRTLAAGAFDGSVRAWDAATREPRGRPTAHNAPVSACSFAPDGSRLAVAYGRWVSIEDPRASRAVDVLRPRYYALKLLASGEVARLSARGRSAPRAALAEAIAADRPLLVQLVRDDRLLREQEIAPRIGEGPLDLSARLEGGRLELDVNGASVAFQDMFALDRTAGRVFGLDLPASARIEGLTASCQRPPARPSPIERGDELYAAEDWRRALDAYREQQREATDPAVLQEARCKEGVCLEALGHRDEAVRVLEQVAVEDGERWPVIAGLRLWLLHLNARQTDKARVVYTRLSSQRGLERVAALVPLDVPQAIVDAYVPNSTHFRIIPRPELVADMETAAAVAREIGLPAAQQAAIRWSLAQAYHQFGRLDRAREAYAALLVGPLLDASDEALVVQNLGWALGGLGRDREALGLYDARLPAGGAANEILRVGRAQVRARLGDWAGCVADLDEYLRRVPEFSGWHYEALLLQGFAREALGDRDGARRSWRRGYLAASGTQDMALLGVAIMASLSGELSDGDARIMFNTVVGRLPVILPPMQIVGGREFRFEDAVSALRTVWTTERGRAYARRIAALDVSFADFFSVQVPLTVGEICRYGAFGGTISRDDEEIVWAAMNHLFRDYLGGKYGDSTLIRVMSAWIGLPTLLTWRPAAATMSPETRALTAYVVGARYRQLGKPDEARLLFQAALDEAPPDGPLRRRAREAIAALR